MHKREKTFIPADNKGQFRWFLFDATGKTLGRLASEVAKILRGKHHPTFTPHMDCGDGVIIINAEKVHVSGNKRVQKLYRHYTGSMGGLHEIPFDTKIARNPTHPVETAVTRMLPKSRLGEQQKAKLRVFAGEDHGMEAQQPIPVNI